MSRTKLEAPNPLLLEREENPEGLFADEIPYRATLTGINMEGSGMSAQDAYDRLVHMINDHIAVADAVGQLYQSKFGLAPTNGAVLVLTEDEQKELKHHLERYRGTSTPLALIMHRL